MTRWHVTTPTYPVHEYVEHMLAQVYDAADYLEIEAPTRREAKAIAVRQWLAERSDNYCQGRKLDGLSPYKGIAVQSEAEVKAECFAGGPPKWAPDFCDLCPEAVIAAAEGWVWLEDGIDEDVRWGWFGVCADHQPLSTSSGTSA